MNGVVGLDLLIDEAGRTWPNGSFALRDRLIYPSPDIDLAAYLVRNMGFVRLRVGARSIRLGLRAGRLQFATLETTVRLLLAQPWRRLVIEHVDRIPGYEIFGELEEAVARLKDLAALSYAVTPATRFFNQELSIDRLNGPGQEQLRGLLDVWLNRRGNLPVDHIVGAIPARLKPRMTLIRAVAPTRMRSSRAVVEHVGAGFRVFDACWAVGAIGRDLEEQPDPSYGARSSEAYHEVATCERPRFEHVDALIDVPGRPVRRSRYERLMLPWRSRGETFVSGVSILRSSYPLESASIQAMRS